MNPVTLQQLITRVRQRMGIEGFSQAITDWEITDSLNCSLATELYDIVRQAVGDNYYRRAYQITTQVGTNSYDLPADFLSLISVDVWLQPPTVPGAQALKLNARRYMEYERNYYQQILLGWQAGATALYTLSGPSIVFQPTPTQSVACTLNYVPVSPQLGGGQNTTGSVPLGQAQPCNYSDTWDDINGWSELAVLDAAKKGCFKLQRLDMVGALNAERADLRRRVQGLLALRHAGEPERTQMPWSPNWGGDGWRE